MLLPLVFVSGFLPLEVLSLPDLVKIINSNGYPAEEHVVTTTDGFYTVLYRIPTGKNSSKIGKPILVTHGIMASSAAFLNTGPGKAFAYVLADYGYDVWLSNCRGNSYSKKVTPKSINTNSKGFNDYSFHEIGIYDYTAQIDYILENTDHKSLYYAGHSQGGTALYAMLSKKPEYNSKIRVATLFASPIFLSHIDFFLKIISQWIYFFEFLTNFVHSYAPPLPSILRSILPTYCKLPLTDSVCRSIYNNFAGYDDYSQLESSLLPIIFQTTPSDTSFKTLYHFGQIARNGVFREYDYRLGNIAKYGSIEPPKYNLNAITVPISMYYGLNDKLVHEEDINAGAQLLPNVVNKYQVPWKLWNHGDFTNAKDASKLVYKHALKIMENY